MVVLEKGQVQVLILVGIVYLGMTLWAYLSNRQLKKKLAFMTAKKKYPLNTKIDLTERLKRYNVNGDRDLQFIIDRCENGWYDDYMSPLRHDGGNYTGATVKAHLVCDLQDLKLPHLEELIQDVLAGTYDEIRDNPFSCANKETQAK